MMMQEKQKLIEWLLLLGVIFIHIVSHFVKGMSQQNLILSTGSILIACHITTSPSFIDFFFFLQLDMFYAACNIYINFFKYFIFENILK